MVEKLSENFLIWLGIFLRVIFFITFFAIIKTSKKALYWPLPNLKSRSFQEKQNRSDNPMKRAGSALRGSVKNRIAYSFLRQQTKKDWKSLVYTTIK